MLLPSCSYLLYSLSYLNVAPFCHFCLHSCCQPICERLMLATIGQHQKTCVIFSLSPLNIAVFCHFCLHSCRQPVYEWLTLPAVGQHQNACVSHFCACIIPCMDMDWSLCCKNWWHFQEVNSRERRESNKKIIIFSCYAVQWGRYFIPVVLY
jgi:hypothetical protein